ncbi:hypothetical protein CYY_000378 [Polysphondylium violaceum]|uniref:Peptidase S1 domain-containing protein n=1 Tax=Polysphondylium violaceum TaxID=133409 RepID=A0A8J4UX76_9MYCE|nr:hypothetical protein CYY_000378 [Polysphondylium violaceum]
MLDFYSCFLLILSIVLFHDAVHTLDNKSNSSNSIQQTYNVKDSRQFEIASERIFTTHYNIKTILHTLGDPNIELFSGHQESTAWNADWYGKMGMTTLEKCPYFQDFMLSNENYYFCTLPYNDIDKYGRKSSAHLIPWATLNDPQDHSILKNKWIRVAHKNSFAFCQIEDVGPENDDDFHYVFGASHSIPESSVGGLAISPIVANFLGIMSKFYENYDSNGKLTTTDEDVRCSWQFFQEEDVPEGPWKKRVTRSKSDHIQLNYQQYWDESNDLKKIDTEIIDPMPAPYSIPSSKSTASTSTTSTSASTSPTSSDNNTNTVSAPPTAAPTDTPATAALTDTPSSTAPPSTPTSTS